VSKDDTNEAHKNRKVNDYIAKGVLGEDYKQAWTLRWTMDFVKIHTKVVSDNLKLTVSINMP